MNLPFYSSELQGYFFYLNCQVSAISTKTAKTPYFGGITEQNIYKIELKEPLIA